jgi:hypothetical protein
LRAAALIEKEKEKEKEKKKEKQKEKAVWPGSIVAARWRVIQFNAE